MIPFMVIDEKSLDFTGIDIRLPLFVYVSREKRPGYDHNKKARAMNAMVRASAILSNGPFVLNLDCDHYIYNSLALREGMCFMMDRAGDRICNIQFPQHFEGIDPSDRYANHNTVLFDGNMRALDGLQGPEYVGTGSQSDDDEEQPLNVHPDPNLPKTFGNSALFSDSIQVCEFQARPLIEHKSVKNGRPPGALLAPRPPLDAPTVAEAIAVIACCAHLAAVLQGPLKVIAGIEISFTLTSKSTAEDEDDIYSDLYVVKWTSLFIVPLTIMVINVVALVLKFSRTVYSVIPQWNKFFGGAFFSFWVLAHLYPFVKGLLGRKGKLPTIVYVWTGLVTITVSLLWISISLLDDTTIVNFGGDDVTHEARAAAPAPQPKTMLGEHDIEDYRKTRPRTQEEHWLKVVNPQVD
ncbi:hypothetical protein Syun_003491 [Stephania yunnanensis]|uniref:Uncharacterized protein n=1 Tax=Stephania yunnanensis TaxID=152371 RepID=A0AAP0L3C0_9MAGN